MRLHQVLPRRMCWVSRWRRCCMSHGRVDMTSDLTRHQRPGGKLNNSWWRCGGNRRSRRRGGSRRLRRRGGSRRLRLGRGSRRLRRCGGSRRLRLGRGSRRRPGDFRARREVTRSESRCLVNHPRLRVLGVRVEVRSARANWVIRHAQVDGLARIQRADLDLRLIDHTHEPAIWFSEQGDRGDVVCHVGRHRRGHVRSCYSIW